MCTRHAAIFYPGRSKQRGAALMVMLVIMILGAAAFLVSALSSSALQTARQETTAAALAQAKDALIGRAVKDANHPGSLPCPDTNNDGSAELFIGNHCPDYVGRLPWKTLGLPDLRDGDGERLWYALSPSVRDYSSATQSLNSDTPGQFNITGNITVGNVVAIVFAPGSVLSSLNQVRDTANGNNAANYLEGNNATNDAAINADIAGGTYTSASTYTFTGNASSSTFNDGILAITADQVFPLVEKRIAKEVSNCLQDYASANSGSYPWAAPLSSTSYLDASDTLFGRLPAIQSSPSPLPDSRADSNSPKMSDHWPSTAACNGAAAWWSNWKELIFYSLSDAYSPNNNPAPASCDPTCLVVNPPPATRDKKIVVIVAGKALPGQVRNTATAKANVFNYMEGNNYASGNAGGTVFEQGPRNATFNDTLLFQ